VEIFFKKIFAREIPTAQKNFCQVAELLMPREWCRKRGLAGHDGFGDFSRSEIFLGWRSFALLRILVLLDPGR
jgi:hypothetical protein